LPGVTGDFSALGLEAAGGAGEGVVVSCAAAGAAWSLSVARQLILACLFLAGKLSRRSSGGSFWKAEAAAAFWKGCLEQKLSWV
jgi:hypothetical protein